MDQTLQHALDAARSLVGRGERVPIGDLLGLLRLADRLDDVDTYAFASYELYWASGDGSSRDRLRRAASMAPQVSGWSARAQAAEQLIEGDLDASVKWNEVALDISRAAGDSLLETLSLEQLGVVRSLRGETELAIALLEDARRRAQRAGLHAWVVSAQAILCDVLGDANRHLEALDVAAAACDYARANDLGRRVPLCEAFHAIALDRCGRVAEARDVALASLESLAALEQRTDAHETIVVSIAAHVLLDAGDRERAGAVVDEASRRATVFGYAPFEFEAELARARLAELNGNEDDAVELARRIVPGDTGERCRLALWLARMAARRRDVDLAELAVSIMDVRLEGVAMASCARSEVAAISRLLAGADGAVDVAAVDRMWREAELPLESARCRLALAVAHRGDPSVDDLRAVLEDLQRSGARRDAEVAASSLRAAGVHVAVRGLSDASGLTARQRDVAVLVRDGLGTVEIAEALDVSAETVRYHLKGAFQHAGVRSRAELAAWMRRREP